MTMVSNVKVDFLKEKSGHHFEILKCLCPLRISLWKMRKNHVATWPFYVPKLDYLKWKDRELSDFQCGWY